MVEASDRSQLARTGTVLRESLVGGAENPLLPLHVRFVEEPVNGSVVGVVDAVGRMVGARPARRVCVVIHCVMGVYPYPQVVYLL